MNTPNYKDISMSIERENLPVNDQDDFDQISIDSEDKIFQYIIVPKSLIRSTDISSEAKIQIMKKLIKGDS